MNVTKTFTKIEEVRHSDPVTERIRANHAQALKELQNTIVALQAAVTKLGG